jgi:tetratricopeptide (TPR) repeat protein
MVQKALKVQADKDEECFRCSDITPDLILTSTARVSSVMVQMKTIMEGQGQGRKTRKSITTALPEALPPVELRQENIVGISTLVQNIAKVMEGKFFLCRTITKASQNVAIETAVEDPTGKEAIRIALYNFSSCRPSTTNYDTVLPCGTMLAIKNPLFQRIDGKRLMLRCDSPSDVEVLSPKRMSRLLPDIAWQGVIPPYASIHPVDDFWNFVSNTDEKTVAERLQKLGNIAFVDKRYVDAVRWYNLSLEYSEGKSTETELFANRAAAFLNLRCYQRALADCEYAIKKEPFHEKAVFRKTKALWGLKKYHEANKFIRGKLEDNPALSDNISLKNLAKTAQCMAKTASENRGGVDIMKLLQIEVDVQFVDDVCEYTGPVTIRDIPKKGRGLIATEDIQPGQIVIISKAFALAKQNQNEEVAQFSMNLDTKQTNLPGHDALVAQIAYKIHFEPESGEEFYNLFAGPELGSLGSEPWRATSVDVKRIDRIVCLDAFCCTKEPDKRIEDEESVYGCAIWVLPSFINHSCVANCKFIPYGDVMIVRAVQPIKKGEEILVPYCIPILSYADRKQTCSAYLLNCECKLCELDSDDEKDGTAKKREKIITKFRAYSESTSAVGMRQAISEVSKLVELRKLHPQLNFCLVSIGIEMVVAKLYKMKDYQSALELLNTLYSISKETPMPTQTAMVAVQILRCYMFLGRVKSMKDWVQKVKKGFMIAYGSIEPIKIFCGGIVGDLSALGINYFDDAA